MNIIIPTSILEWSNCEEEKIMKTNIISIVLLGYFCTRKILKSIQ